MHWDWCLTLTNSSRLKIFTVDVVIPWSVSDHIFSIGNHLLEYQQSLNLSPGLESFVSHAISWKTTRKIQSSIFYSFYFWLKEWIWKIIWLNYFFLEQWQRLPEDEVFPVRVASWHLFRWEDERGGLPAATMARPILPLETLPSPVMEDMKEELVVVVEYWETDKSVDSFGLEIRSGFRFDLTITGLAKSRVVDRWWLLNWWLLNFSGWGWDRGGGGAGEGDGAWRKRAWPVRFNRLMTCLNFETVKSVISVQSRLLRSRRWRLWEEEEEGVWEERIRMRCSMLFKPAEAASWIAICSSIFMVEEEEEQEVLVLVCVCLCWGSGL